MEILGIVGSLRQDSYNKMVLRTAAAVAPTGMTVIEHPLDAVPLYNFDIEQDGDPDGVRALKAAIADCDGLLIVTPEYQHGIPGVLKNALDWASRPPGGSPLDGKPVAIMGVSPGMTGTARAQTQLRQTLTYNACPVLPPPEVLIGRVHEKVGEEGGVLSDERTCEFVAKTLGRFVTWIERVRSTE